MIWHISSWRDIFFVLWQTNCSWNTKCWYETKKIVYCNLLVALFVMVCDAAFEKWISHKTVLILFMLILFFYRWFMCYISNPSEKLNAFHCGVSSRMEKTKKHIQYTANVKEMIIKFLWNLFFHWISYKYEKILWHIFNKNAYVGHRTTHSRIQTCTYSAIIWNYGM